MPSISPVVLLLVQVDIDSREMYAEFLRYHGFLPIPVKTASDALTVARHADVIVTETLLPGRIDGIEFIARLKRDERTKTIPVIVFTVCAWHAERERAEKAGCEAFLAKPCLPDELLREVRRVLASSQLRDVSGTATRGDLPNESADHRGLARDSTVFKRHK
jgi:CheY-like chemotaxis protein